MSLTIDFDFISYGSWNGGASPPDQPYLYSPMATDVAGLKDGVIIFSNMPNGMSILNAPDTTSPYDSVYFDINGYDDSILLKNNNGFWSWPDNSTLGASYTSGGYWAYGSTIGSPGVILTGSGDANTHIADIQWVGIDEAHNYTSAPAPFGVDFVLGFSWNATLPNEIMTSYDVISPNSIQIRPTGAGGSGFNDIPRVLRNLYVVFSQPT